MYVLFGSTGASSTGIVLLNKLLCARLLYFSGYADWLASPHHAWCFERRNSNQCVSEQEISAKVRRVVLCVRRHRAMALQNLSLTYNTINFYQTCKLFTIPVTVIIERFAGQAFPKASKMVSLALITCGVALCTGANFNTNTIGVCVGLGATIGLRVSTCLDLLVAKVTRALLKSIVAQRRVVSMVCYSHAWSISRLSFIASYFVQAL